jgi:hypothetical protein
MTTNAPARPHLPRYLGQDEALRAFLNQFTYQLETILADMQTPAGHYTTSNYVATRSLDGTSAALGDVRNVLATLVDDLRRHGVLA